MGNDVNAAYPGVPIPWDQPASILSGTSTPFPPDPPPPTSSGRRQFTPILQSTPGQDFPASSAEKNPAAGKKNSTSSSVYLIWP